MFSIDYDRSDYCNDCRPSALGSGARIPAASCQLAAVSHPLDAQMLRAWSKLDETAVVTLN